MITAISKDGQNKRKLIFNDSVLMFDKYDTITFHVGKERLDIDMKVVFMFSDSGDKFTADGKVSDDKSVITLTLNN